MTEKEKAVIAAIKHNAEERLKVQPKSMDAKGMLYLVRMIEKLQQENEQLQQLKRD